MAALTFAQLWDFCDRERVSAQASADANGRDAAVRKDEPTRAIHRGAAAAYSQRAAYFEALQRLIARIEQSESIRAELKRLAASERKQAAPAAEPGATDEANDEG